MKKFWKIFWTLVGLDLVENIILLGLFKIPITSETFIISGLVAIIGTYIVNELIKK